MGTKVLAEHDDSSSAVAMLDGTVRTCAVCNDAHAPNVPLLVPASDRSRPGICAECFSLAQDIEAEGRDWLASTEPRGKIAAQMLYAAAKGSRRHHARIFCIRLLALIGILIATPFVFRNTPRLVTIELQRVGPSSAEVDVGLSIASLEKILPDMPPVATIQHDLVFLPDEPTKVSVWLEQRDYAILAGDMHENRVIGNRVTVAGEDRIVVTFDTSKATPFGTGMSLF
ncbi:MAG: hypothetical protein QM765_28625 [Myxococcales bacterium]